MYGGCCHSFKHLFFSSFISRKHNISITARVTVAIAVEPLNDQPFFLLFYHPNSSITIYVPLPETFTLYVFRSQFLLETKTTQRTQIRNINSTSAILGKHASAIEASISLDNEPAKDPSCPDVMIPKPHHHIRRR